ncbi:MAG: hypothetical protein HYU28_05225 [Actinobacteria bacterium]|nr:hypothetical protein [Actinomycetota bacterium]
MIGPGRAVRDVIQRHPGPLAAKFTYVAAFVSFGLIRGDDRVWSYVFVITVLLVTVSFIHRVARFSRPVAWALAASGAVHMAGGILPSPERGAAILYETWLIDGLLKYDQLAHLFGTAVITVACWELLAHYLDHAKATPAGHAALAAVMGIGFGAVNEVYEFLSSTRFSGLFIGGFQNMGWDLVFNLFGAAAAGLFLGLSLARPRVTNGVEVSVTPG